MNFLSGRVRDGAVEVPGLGAMLEVAVRLPAEGAAVSVGLRPEHLQIGPGDGLSVDLTEALGGVSYAYLDAPTGERLVVEERGDVRSRAGDSVDVAVDPGRTFLFDAESGVRLR
jgi:lactose/L-arabinose transport system ATP-binding protein